MRSHQRHSRGSRRRVCGRRPEVEAVEARCLLATAAQGTAVAALAGVARATASAPIQVGPVLQPEVVAGEAFTNVTVADFWTTLRRASASDFSATIDWGDGSPVSTGAVVPSSFPPFLGAMPLMPVRLGTFDVTGGHTYTASGSFTAKISIRDNAGDTASTTAHVTVSATRLVVQPYSAPFQAITGVSYTAIPLAGFKDLGVAPGTDAPASDYTATSDWGDGTTTAGDITSDAIIPLAVFFHPGSFDVSGAHTYTTAGTFNVHMTVADQAGDTVTATRVVDVSTLSLTAQGRDVSVLTGQADEPLVVASFTTTPADAHVPLSDYSVSIDWGDGTTTAGQVLGCEIPPGPPLTATATPADVADSDVHLVAGEHTYGKAGSYTIHVTIGGPGGASATATSTATVADIAATGVSFRATTNQADTGQTVAFFHTANASAAASDFTATIDWGDGSTTSGTISPLVPPIVVPMGGTATGTATAGGPAILPLFGGGFRVSGDHTYTAAGTYTVHVTITDPAAQSVTTTATATVSNDTIVGFGVPVRGAPGQSIGPVTVATFHDQAGLPVSDFTATIDWGDGTTSAGTVMAAPIFLPLSAAPALSGGAIASPPTGLIPWHTFYLVSGQHTYGAAGQYTIHITITSTLGASANVTSTAFVANPPPPVVPPPTPITGNHHPHGRGTHPGAPRPPHAPTIRHPPSPLRRHH